MNNPILRVALLLSSLACGSLPPEIPPVDVEPPGPALAVLAEDELVLVAPDGTVRTRYPLRATVSPASASTWLGSERGGLIPVVRYIAGPGEHSSQQRALLSRGGRVMWEETMRGRCEWAYATGVLPGDDGDFVSCNAGPSSWTYHRADGGTVDMGEVDVLAAPLSGGRVPVLAQRDGSSSCGFWSAETGAFEPWAHPDCASVNRLGPSVVYLAISADGRTFVENGPGGERLIGGPLDGQRGVILEVNEDTNEALLGATDTTTPRVRLDSLVRIDAQRNARAVPVLMPSTNLPYTAGASWPHLAPNGQLLLGQRNDYSAALFQSSDGREWTRIGAGLVGIDGVTATTRAQTTAIAGRRVTHAPLSFRQGYEHTIAGDSIQVISPEDQTVLLTPARASLARPLPLSRDGRWLAYWNDTSLVIFDVREGTLTAVPSLADPRGHSALVWVE